MIVMLNKNIRVAEGGILEAMQFALKTSGRFVLSMVEITNSTNVEDGIAQMVAPALATVGLTADEFAQRILKHSVQFINAGFHDMPVDEFINFVNAVSEEINLDTTLFLLPGELLNSMRLLSSESGTLAH